MTATAPWQSSSKPPLLGSWPSNRAGPGRRAIAFIESIRRRLLEFCKRLVPLRREWVIYLSQVGWGHADRGSRLSGFVR